MRKEGGINVIKTTHTQESIDGNENKNSTYKRQKRQESKTRK